MWVCMYVCIYVCLCTYVWGHRTSLGIILGMLSTFFKMGCLGWNILRVEQSSGTGALPVSASSTPRLQACVTMPDFSLSRVSTSIYFTFLSVGAYTYLGMPVEVEQLLYQVDCAFTHWAVSPTHTRIFHLGAGDHIQVLVLMTSVFHRQSHLF